jgi:hypothetical protein
MTGNILAFRHRDTEVSPWSQGELAECFRVCNLLHQVGLPVLFETGASDEGDPWLVFVREDTDDVLVHIARIDGTLLAASLMTDRLVRAPSLRDLLARILRSHPLVLPSGPSSEKLLVHPTAIFVAFVATAYALSAAAAAEPSAVTIDGTGRDPTGGEPGEQAYSPEISPALGAALTRAGAPPSHDMTAVNAGSLDEAASRLPLAATVVAAVLLALAMPESAFDSPMPAASDGMDGDIDIMAAKIGDTHATRPTTGFDAVLIATAAQADDEIGRIYGADQAASVLDAASDSPALRGPWNGYGKDSWLLALKANGDDATILTALSDQLLSPPDGLVEASWQIENGLDHWGIKPGSASAFGVDGAWAQGEESDLLVERAVSRIEARHEAERAAEAAASDARAAEASVPSHAQDDVATPESGARAHDTSLAEPRLLHTPWGSIESEAAMYLRLTQSSGEELIDFGSRVAATTNGAAMQADHGPAASTDAAAHEESTAEIMRAIIQFAQAPTSEIADEALARAADAAVRSNPFMLHVDRILIFDAPYVTVPMFMLMPNVAMVSEELFKDKLPASAAATSIDFTLDDGSHLRLVGVIDLLDFPTV